MDQWNETENPNMNPQAYGHLKFNEEAKIIQCKMKESSTNVSDLTGFWHEEKSKPIHI